MRSVLATGFGPFPGAPVNPTALLMERLTKDPPDLGLGARFAAATIPTVYATLPDELARLGAAHAPDVAVLFGLAQSARGFRLERRARNRVNASRADAAGARPEHAILAAGLADLPSTLPLESIAAALTGAGLPTEWSDDCGDYLCNAMFFHAAAGLVPIFAPRVTGFVHVPAPSDAFDLAMLEKGARLILRLAATGAGSGP